MRTLVLRPALCALGVLLALAGLVVAGGGAVDAQTSTTLVGNSGQTTDDSPDDSRSLADSDLAQSFSTGPNAAGYTLTGVSLYFGDVVDASAKYAVSIYSYSPGVQAQLVAALTQQGSLVADSLNDWTADGDGAYLSANGLYYVVIDSNDPADNEVGHTYDGDEDGGAATGWSIGDFSQRRARDESRNDWAPRSASLQMQIRGYARTSTDTAPPAAPAPPTVTAPPTVACPTTSTDTAPCPPTSEYTSLNVNWTPPASTGSPITGYEVEYRAGTSGGFAPWPHTDATVSTTITGLTADTSYQVRVRATNANGASGWSAPGTGSTNATSGGAPSFSSATFSDQTFAKHVQVGVQLPEAEGGDSPLTYTLTGPSGSEGLPAGLSFNAGALFLYGWPTAIQDEKTYTYTVTDHDNESDTLTFKITVTIGGV